MKHYIKYGAKILSNYSVTVLFFLIFMYPFMSIAGDYFDTLLPYYCFLFFVFIAFLTYAEMKELAIKELKPEYELDPKPWKGIVIGLIAITPVVIVVSILTSMNLENEVYERIKHLAINGILGPMYFFIRWFRESVIGYIMALLLLPAISTLGYLAGYYGIDIIGKFIKKKEPQAKVFAKSPWNPTLHESVKKKKRKKTSGGQ